MYLSNCPEIFLFYSAFKIYIRVKYVFIIHFRHTTTEIDKNSCHSSLITIFDLVIPAKLDYESFSFLLPSLESTNPNSILLSHLSYGAIYSTHLIILEVECVYPPIQIRSRTLAGNFLLKSLDVPWSQVFNYCYKQ